MRDGSEQTISSKLQIIQQAKLDSSSCLGRLLNENRQNRQKLPILSETSRFRSLKNRIDLKILDKLRKGRGVMGSTEVRKKTQKKSVFEILNCLGEIG